MMIRVQINTCKPERSPAAGQEKTIYGTGRIIVHQAGHAEAGQE